MVLYPTIETNAFKVRELMSILKMYDDELPVFFVNDSGANDMPITTVSFEETHFHGIDYNKSESRCIERKCRIVLR